MIALDHDTGVTSEITTTASKSGWSVRIPNVVFDVTKVWQRRPPHSHPILAIKGRTNASDYGHLNLADPNLRSTRPFAVCDSRAQFSLVIKDILYSWGKLLGGKTNHQSVQKHEYYPWKGYRDPRSSLSPRVWH